MIMWVWMRVIMRVIMRVNMVMAMVMVMRMVVVIIPGMFMRVRMGVCVRMLVRGQLRKGLRHHWCVQVAALAGIDLDGGRAGGADAVGIEAGLLIALDHRHADIRSVLFEGMDGGAQQCSLARSGAGDQVQDAHAMRGKVRAVLRGNGVVGSQHIFFDLDGALLGQAGYRHLCRARAEVQIAGGGVNFRT